MTTLDLWASDFTPEIVALAKSRILDGGNIASKSSLDQRSAKLVLLLVREMNPLETLTSGEQAILTGNTLVTLRQLKKEGSFSNVVNFIF